MSKRLMLVRILRLLQERGGLISDRELLELLRREYDISYTEFISALMKLEVEGFIHVIPQKEDMRVIKLRKSIR
ncbi:MAG: hypothetical protein DRO12_01925 [Thermoprotei archaeon]|nr:MAG: hypothetical protein DRO12_01925 [Thermoprotei archaeon]